MSETISGYQTTVQILSPSKPTVSIVGTINAYGSVATYPITQGSGTTTSQTIDAALFGSAGAFFTLDNTGLIESHGTAANPFDVGVLLGGDGSVTNSGTIEAGTGLAIFGTAAASYLHNTGLIAGSVGIGAIMMDAVSVNNAGRINGVQGALEANGVSTITNQIGATISSSSYQAIRLHAGGKVTNDGIIIGGSEGIELGAVGSVQNSGQISVTGTGTQSSYAGINFYAGGTATNSGTIAGQNGIILDYHPGNTGSGYTAFIGYVGNHGLIVATGTANATTNALSGFLNSGAGIYLADPGSVVNAGQITASHVGIAIERGSGQITNISGGTIVAAGGYGLYVQNGGYVLNQGLISGDRDGMVAGTITTVINDGTIEATGPKFTISGTVFNPFAIEITGAATITNASGAVISGAHGIDIHGATNVATTLDNAGQITASVGNAVYFYLGANASNSGTIIGDHEGMVFDQSANLLNDGSVGATGTVFTNSKGTQSAFGVVVGGGGTITNAVGAHISGYGGVYFADSLNGSGYLDNLGVITGTGRPGVFLGALSALTNQGSIIAGSSASAVDIVGVDMMTNAASGVITGGIAGVFTDNTANLGATILNYGHLQGGGFGVDLQTGGSLANDGAGLITGAVDGVTVGLPDASIVNHGTIAGGVGVVIGASNFFTSTTIQNFGTIIGTGGVAIDFAGTSLNNIGDLIIDPGAVFNGGVEVANGVGVMELASAAAAGTLSGFDAGFTGFSTINIDPGAIWRLSGATDLSAASGLTLDNSGTLAEVTGDLLTITGSVTGSGTISIDQTTLTLNGAVASGQIIEFAQQADVLALGDPGSFSATLSGFTLGDTIALTSLASSAIVSDSFSNGVLTLNEVIGSVSSAIALTFASPASFPGETFALTSGGATSTDISLVACFAAGTRILTAEGPVAVEALAIDDHVVLHGGGTAPIIWLGQRRIDLRHHAKPMLVRPILIRAGAIADGIPQRDLLLSPDHALLLDGHLIPAKALENGSSIRQLAPRAITYYHVELADHAVIYAEGTPAESYLECGNRAAFADGGPVLALHPDFGQAQREARSCAPFIEAGPVVEAVRRRCLARTPVSMHTDPQMRVRHQPDGSALIVSRRAVPGLRTADPRDRRMLGVKIAQLLIGGTPVALDDPRLSEGWHDVEPDGRWTNGRARIPAELIGGQAITVKIASLLAYPARQRRAG